MTKDLNELTVALAGNPNAGKTTLFNALTGARQRVGNYPGVTVDIKEGTVECDGVSLNMVDLPGTYSLTAYSEEEVVARNFLMEQAPDVVIDVIDSSNLERNLYLAVQLLELGVPLVLAFNMADVVEKRGVKIDHEMLSKLFGVPIVLTVGHKQQGMDDLLRKAIEVAGNSRAANEQRQPTYGEEIEPHVKELVELLKPLGVDPLHHRWFATKLLEDDQLAIERLVSHYGEAVEPVFKQAASIRKHIESVGGDTCDILLADHRYGYIAGACTEAVKNTVERRVDRSEQIDRILTHPILGLPIFGLLMYLTFQLTFTIGEAPMGWIESGFECLADWLNQLWPRGDDSIIRSLLVDGIIGGVGGVLVFLPNILLLFLAIAFLEGTGYMARAAFIMDKLMHKIGLHGRSFIPMLIGFGCTVPAAMATRTIEARRDRLTTLLILPLFSCGARFPIYALFVPAFFPVQWRAAVFMSMYLIGILLAIGFAKLFRSTLFKGEPTPFVMELPPYRMPPAKGLLMHMWQRSWMYLKKAGTVILAISVVLWAITTFPKPSSYEVDYDAMVEQANASYIVAAEKLGHQITGDPKASFMAKALQAEITMKATQDAYWPSQPEYAEAQKAFDQTLQKLANQSPAVAEFMEVQAAIADAREQFEIAVAEDEIEQWQQPPVVDEKGNVIRPGKMNPAYHVLQQHYQQRLVGLEKKHPKQFSLAVKYLDDIRQPWQEQLEEIGNQKLVEEVSYAISGRIGHAIEPALKPMGFNWRIGTALLGAFAAKEVFVSQLGIVYSVGEGEEAAESLRTRLKAHYTPLTAFCIMLFCLVSMPCMATFAVTAREAGSWKWAFFQIAYLTAAAWLLTTLVYQVGRLIWGG